jgi:hypothetical protein
MWVCNRCAAKAPVVTGWAAEPTLPEHLVFNATKAR